MPFTPFSTDVQHSDWCRPVSPIMPAVRHL